MSWRDRFKRRSAVDTADPLGVAPDAPLLETGDGGPSFYARELANLKWVNTQQSIEASRRELDPERWPKNQPAFNHERSLASSHEALRDQLATLVSDRLRGVIQDLYGVMGPIVDAGENLHDARAARDAAKEHQATLQQEIDEDGLEQSRYYRMQSLPTRLVKYVVIGIIVLSELLISGKIFSDRLQLPYPLLEYVFAAGVITIFIVVPHYAAQGLKEGITQRHVAPKEPAEVGDHAVTRLIKNEEADDKGFRWISLGLCAVLIGLMIPLSLLRSDRHFSGAVGFTFFLLLQIAISGYFFLREWLDHGGASTSLAKVDERLVQLAAAHEAARRQLLGVLTTFHQLSADVVTLIHQAPRWDSYIVETFNATIYDGRHVLLAEQKAELEAFVTWARLPYLGSKNDLDGATYPLDPVSAAHGSLERDDVFGREWWQKNAVGSLKTIDPELTDESDDELGWLFPFNPDKLLADFRRRYLAAAAVAPLELNLPPEPGAAEDDEAQPYDGTGPKPPLQLFPSTESESLRTRGEDG